MTPPGSHFSSFHLESILIFSLLLKSLPCLSSIPLCFSFRLEMYGCDDNPNSDFMAVYRPHARVVSLAPGQLLNRIVSIQSRQRVFSVHRSPDALLFLIASRIYRARGGPGALQGARALTLRARRRARALVALGCVKLVAARLPMRPLEEVGVYQKVEVMIEEECQVSNSDSRCVVVQYRSRRVYRWVLCVEI